MILPREILVTSIDLLLLVACFFALRRAFGKTTAVLVAIYFGASINSHNRMNVVNI